MVSIFFLKKIRYLFGFGAFLNVYVHQSLKFLLPLYSRGSLLFMSAYYWADKMDHVVSSQILSQFLLFLPLRPEAQGSLETCHVTFGCQRSVRRSKRGARRTFHGNAEKQCCTQHPAARLLQAVFGWCQRVWLYPQGGRAPTIGAGRVHICPEVKTAEPQRSCEQKDFPLDERVQTLSWESQQEKRRSVCPWEQANQMGPFHFCSL